MNITFGIANIAVGILMILISIPLVKKKVPMNKLYGFRISKAFSSAENWYNINHCGGRQLIRWSVLLLVIGVLYFFFPIKESRNQIFNAIVAVAPIIICATVPIIKTIIFAREL